jgi:hypothetical protein
VEIKESVEKVEASVPFGKWREAHERAFLASIFTSDKEGDALSLNYYDKETDKMYSFSSEKPTAPKEEEFLRKSEEILPLDMSEIKVTMDDARNKAAKVAEEHYSEEKIIRTITVLQMLEGKQIWNVTFITANYKTINVRIDGSNGEVTSHSKASLIDFMK